MKQRTFLLILTVVFVLFGLLGCTLLGVALWQVANETVTARSEPSSTPVQPHRESGSREATVGEIAPDFTLNDLRSTEQVSLSQFIGQPVMLNFWATWCPPCRKEMPILQDAYEEHKEAGLVILTIAVDDKAKNVLEFSAEHDLTFPLLFDAQDHVAVQYKLVGIPTSYFISSDGVIESVQVGDMTASTLDRYLGEIIDDKMP